MASQTYIPGTKLSYANGTECCTVLTNGNSLVTKVWGDAWWEQMPLADWLILADGQEQEDFIPVAPSTATSPPTKSSMVATLTLPSPPLLLLHAPLFPDTLSQFQYTPHLLPASSPPPYSSPSQGPPGHPLGLVAPANTVDAQEEFDDLPPLVPMNDLQVNQFWAELGRRSAQLEAQRKPSPPKRAIGTKLKWILDDETYRVAIVTKDGICQVKAITEGGGDCYYDNKTKKRYLTKRTFDSEASWLESLPRDGEVYVY